MHKLTEHLNAIKEQGRSIIVPYTMAGDGGFEKTAKIIEIYERVGVSAIEIGIPFSDPVADGPVIEAAGLRALGEGTSLKTTLEFLKKLSQPKVPRLIMTYLNPIIRLGIENFFIEAAEASISGVVIPDMPLEEIEMCLGEAQKYHIALIPLATPQTSINRFEKIESVSNGFVYAVTVNGVTGERTAFPDSLKSRLQELRDSSSLPVLAGFGISSAEQINELKPFCDGFVIGSALVKMADREQYNEIQTFLQNVVKL